MTPSVVHNLLLGSFRACGVHAVLQHAGGRFLKTWNSELLESLKLHLHLALPCRPP